MEKDGELVAGNSEEEGDSAPETSRTTQLGALFGVLLHAPKALSTERRSRMAES